MKKIKCNIKRLGSQMTTIISTFLITSLIFMLGTVIFVAQVLYRFFRLED